MYQEADLNVICLHEAVTEWVGGAHDGAHLVQGFAADLGPMVELFDAPPEIHLDATLASHEQAVYDSPAVSFEGMIDGQPWMIWIYTAPPADAEPGIATNGIQFWNKA